MTLFLLIVDKWHHYAATYDDVTKEMKLYINGILQETETAAIPDFSLNTTGALRIGYYYTGCLDDIIMYDKVLNATDIGLLKDMGTCCQ